MATCGYAGKITPMRTWNAGPRRSRKTRRCGRTCLSISSTKKAGSGRSWRSSWSNCLEGRALSRPRDRWTTQRSSLQLRCDAALLFYERGSRTAAGRFRTVPLWLERLVPVQAFLKHLHQVDHVGCPDRRRRLLRDFLVLRLLLNDLHHRVTIFVAILLRLPRRRHALD